MAGNVDTLFSLVAKNRLGPLIGQTIVVTSRKNRLTNQDRTSPVRDDLEVDVERVIEADVDDVTTDDEIIFALYKT